MNAIRFLALSLILGLAGCVGYGLPSTGGYYGGYPDSGYGQGRPDYGSPSYGYPSHGGGSIRCESEDQRTRRCSIDTRGGVRIVRQLSDTRCVQGRNWGYERGAIWVSGGCRAEFAVGQGGDGYPGHGSGDTIRCESNDNRTRNCSIDTRGGVRLVRQLSDTRCEQGRNWGYDRGGIWVSSGCRAEFAVGRGGGYPGGGAGAGQTVRCESRDNRQARCSVRVNAGVEIQRQLSDTRCEQGRNWGYDRSGIWVSGGCRAEFRVY